MGVAIGGWPPGGNMMSISQRGWSYGFYNPAFLILLGRTRDHHLFPSNKGQNLRDHKKITAHGSSQGDGYLIVLGVDR